MKEQTRLKRCKDCGKGIPAFNKSGFCSACHVRKPSGKKRTRK